MDNAAGAEQVEPLIPPAGCVLLVTSRWHFTLPRLAAKNLDTLTAADARALLLTIASRIGAWAEEIAKLCGIYHWHCDWQPEHWRNTEI